MPKDNRKGLVLSEKYALLKYKVYWYKEKQRRKGYPYQADGKQTGQAQRKVVPVRREREEGREREREREQVSLEHYNN